MPVPHSAATGFEGAFGPAFARELGRMTQSGAAAEARGLDEAASPLLDPGERAFWTGLIVVVLSLVSALLTFLILTGLTPITPRDEVVVGVLLVNAILIAVMIAITAWQAYGLWQAWKQKLAGARLHVRIVILFSLIAALPAMLLAVAATTTFSRSLDGWFSNRTRAIIDNSLDVAKLYLEEHGLVIRTDAVNMARDIDAAIGSGAPSDDELTKLLIGQAGLRELPLAYIVDEEGKPLISAFEDDAPYLPPSQSLILKAKEGHVPVLTRRRSARIAAIAKLENAPGKYLYVARPVSAKVLGHLARTVQSVDEYKQLRQARGGLKLAHGLMYTMISLTALLAAVWVGFWFANRFAAPIRRLIGGAQEISKGNLDVELPERRGEGDLRRLSHTFNTMSRELKNQRDALMSANEELSERRRFIEAVLAGVSAGVIGLDSQDRVTLLSRSAENLLGTREEDVSGQPLAVALPMLAPILERASEPSMKPRAPLQIQATVNGEERMFSVSMMREEEGQGDVGSVVTLDDITELVSAQRTSAWADVARRIAHEIKNPLTPIILSAERIRKKYGKVIVEDRETFDKLTATIERQAGDIKTMVDEFASFARVPKPVMEPGDLRDTLQEPMILFRESHPGVTYRISMPEGPVKGSFDRRLLTQAITNLVKNATEATEQAAETEKEGFRGLVEARLIAEPDRIEIEVIDNGVGLPKQNRSRLLEPYVTTKGSKGTGLGLAIVQKIVEQHGGVLTLEDAPPAEGREHGALVRISLPGRLLAPAKTADSRPAPASAAGA